MTPERRLWGAVVELTLLDAKQLAKSIRKNHRKFGCSFVSDWWEMKELLNCVDSRWFARIVEEYCDLSIGRVQKAMREYFKDLETVKYLPLQEWNDLLESRGYNPVKETYEK